MGSRRLPPAAGPGLDAKQIEQASGAERGRALDGGVFQVTVPTRAEAITEMGVPLLPAMGVTTVMNFQPTADGKAAITGDFVLDRQGSERRSPGPLLQHGIDVTAIHNHGLMDTPRLFYMHFWANDDPVKLVRRAQGCSGVRPTARSPEGLRHRKELAHEMGHSRRKPALIALPVPGSSPASSTRSPRSSSCPRATLLAVAKKEEAIPYDVPDVELGHHGDQCSFDAFVDKYELSRSGPPGALPSIVRGADTDARGAHAGIRWPVRGGDQVSGPGAGRLRQHGGSSSRVRRAAMTTAGRG